MIVFKHWVTGLSARKMKPHRMDFIIFISNTYQKENIILKFNSIKIFILQDRANVMSSVKIDLRGGLYLVGSQMLYLSCSNLQEYDQIKLIPKVWLNIL